MIYDVNENGNVSVDETQGMIYSRYGRAGMDQKIRELFGEEMTESASGTQGGEITFTQYKAAVKKVMMTVFLNSEYGTAMPHHLRERAESVAHLL